MTTDSKQLSDAASGDSATTPGFDVILANHKRQGRTLKQAFPAVAAASSVFRSAKKAELHHGNTGDDASKCDDRQALTSACAAFRPIKNSGPDCVSGNAPVKSGSDCVDCGDVMCDACLDFELASASAVLRSARKAKLDRAHFPKPGSDCINCEDVLCDECLEFELEDEANRRASACAVLGPCNKPTLDHNSSKEDASDAEEISAETSVSDHKSVSLGDTSGEDPHCDAVESDSDDSSGFICNSSVSSAPSSTEESSWKSSDEDE